jgi:ABC-2 type transport system ATP-binding protein
MTALVELSGVGHRFGGTWALRDVDLTLSPGVVGLLGPNGAGKSTLLRIVSTSLGQTTGQVSILGYRADHPKERTEIRRNLGYVPQELGYPRGFTTFGFVDYVAVLKEWTAPKARHAEVRRVLELVGLTSVSTKRIRTLSGGQRRRLGVAQALLRRPRLLVLDEPTTGLDPEQRAALRGTLAEIGREAVVLMATHQTEDIAALCERVVVLDAGRVQFDGGVRDFVDRAAGRAWLADEPDAAAAASWRTGSGQYRNVAAAAPAGVQAATPTLEDAYLLQRAGLLESPIGIRQ